MVNFGEFDKEDQGIVTIVERRYEYHYNIILEVTRVSHGYRILPKTRQARRYIQDAD